jgi:hypothetical protein
MKDNIQGWLHKTVMDYVNQIDEIQKANNEVGNIVEIGVHHGKFFIPLAKLNTNDKTLNIAIDLFENQEENISNSGCGNFEMFNKWCVFYEVKNLHIISKNSLNLDYLDLQPNNLKSRIFSVDGGHFTKEVENDLYLAQNTISDNGVIIVDDFQHPMWDDVFVSTFKFLLNNKEIKPFLMGGDKLFLCKSDCNLYDNLTHLLDITKYHSNLLPHHDHRQSLKIRTMLLLYPSIQLFNENFM